MMGCGPRLKTQTLSCRSTATPEDSPKFQPLGSWAQFLTTLWGRGGPDLSSTEAAGSVEIRESSSRRGFISVSPSANKHTSGEPLIQGSVLDRIVGLLCIFIIGIVVLNRRFGRLRFNFFVCIDGRFVSQSCFGGGWLGLPEHRHECLRYRY